MHIIFQTKSDKIFLKVKNTQILKFECMINLFLPVNEYELQKALYNVYFKTSASKDIFQSTIAIRPDICIYIWISWQKSRGGEICRKRKNMTNCALEAHKMGTKIVSKTLSKWLYFT